jgi:glutamate/aspartate transport system substrate-binding protein
VHVLVTEPFYVTGYCVHYFFGGNMKLAKLASVLVGATVLMGSVHAQELTGTLKKIKDSGTLTLGVRDASIPFSYLDDKQQYMGYSIDLCMKAASAIQKKLGLKQLNIKMVPVTSATRIPLISNGTTDISCDSATNNLERQKQVAFSVTEFVTANRILAKKSSNIKTLADLKGKTVVSTSGTSNIKQLTALNNELQLGMNILAAKDHAEAFLMVETDRAAAFVMDDILLAGLAANSKSPADYVITDEALSVEPYGLILRKNDEPFKKVVDDALIAVYQSPEIISIYDKWFNSPIPPKGVNLNVPMSASLKAVMAKPTDSGDPAAYAVVPQTQKKPAAK